MEFWEDSKVTVIGCCAALLLLLLVHLFFFRPVLRELAHLSQENEKLEESLEIFYPEGGMSVESLMSMFGMSNAKLKSHAAGLKEKMALKPRQPFVVPPPEISPQPGFYFRQLLTKKRDVLLFYASKRNMDITDRSLGFGEDVPKDEAVEELLKQLAAACEVIKLAADSGVKVVERIEHRGVVKKGVPGYTEFLEERPMRATVRCDLEALTRFLHGLGEGEIFLGLRGLTVESRYADKSGLLSVRVECVTLGFLEPVQAIEKPQPTGGPAQRRPAPTYGL